jgi:hypothetical protein
MSQNITERKIYEEFVDTVLAKGWGVVSVWRGERGGYDRAPDEYHKISNQVLAAGLNELAAKMIVTSRPAYGWIAVGTQTAAGSLGSVWGGEVGRKAAATLASSKMTCVLVATWGGAADSVTSLAMETAAIVNHANSGSGIPLNLLTGVAATLANSDLLSLQMNFAIGSHNL